MNKELWIVSKKESVPERLFTCQENKNLKNDLSVLAALFFSFNILNHLTDRILLFRFWLLIRTFLSFHSPEGQGLNVPLNKDNLSTATKMLWVEWSYVFRTTYSIDGWGQIFQNLLQTYFGCCTIVAIFQFVCQSSIVTEGLPTMRNNKLIWCWNSHSPKEYFWVNDQHHLLPFGCLL